jgi:Integrase core domain
VTDITYIRTYEGWLYLAVVIDLFSRRVVGWSAQPRMTTDLALQALLAAVWRRKPKAKVMIHSDQGSQFTSREWQVFLGQHNLEASMSRRGNCHHNAVAESFFQLLKRVRIRRRTYLTREAARQDVFDYIEMFYNPKRKHTNNGMLSPVDFETRQQKLNEADVQETRGTSWTGRATHHIRASFENEIGHADLQKAWAPLSLENYADKLARTDLALQFVFAKRVTVVLPELSRRFVKSLKNAGAVPSILERNSGHYSLSMPPQIIWAGLDVLRLLSRDGRCMFRLGQGQDAS